MLLKSFSNWRLFLATMLMWLGTVSDAFALTPVTVDVKPFMDGYVTARTDGMLIWTDMAYGRWE